MFLNDFNTLSLSIIIELVLTASRIILLFPYFSCSSPWNFIELICPTSLEIHAQKDFQSQLLGRKMSCSRFVSYNILLKTFFFQELFHFSVKKKDLCFLVNIYSCIEQCECFLLKDICRTFTTMLLFIISSLRISSAKSYYTFFSSYKYELETKLWTKIRAWKATLGSSLNTIS